MTRLASSLLIGSALALTMSGCSKSTSNAAAPVSPAQKAVSTAPPPVVTEIYIHRDPGMTVKPLPHYGLTLRPDGTATYIGELFAPGGTYKATFERSDYVHLAELIQKCDFQGFERFYGPTADDVPETLVSVVSEGARKTVFDRGDLIDSKNEKVAPQALKEIERLIDAAVVDAKWVKVSDKAKAPDYRS